jgi:hypothetical protein
VANPVEADLSEGGWRHEATRRRLIAAVVLVALTVGFGWGPAHGVSEHLAMTSASTLAAPAPDEVAGWMARMHDSPEMRELHEQMPAELREACDAMHAAMLGGSMMDGPMMGGGMMGGGPMMGGGFHAEHHG